MKAIPPLFHRADKIRKKNSVIRRIHFIKNLPRVWTIDL